MDTLLLFCVYLPDVKDGEKSSAEHLLFAAQLLDKLEGPKPMWRIVQRECANISASVVQFSKENNAHTIVLGSRGLSGVKKMLLGSVADGVLKATVDESVAVVIVRAQTGT